MRKKTSSSKINEKEKIVVKFSTFEFLICILTFLMTNFTEKSNVYITNCSDVDLSLFQWPGASKMYGMLIEMRMNGLSAIN